MQPLQSYSSYVAARPGSSPGIQQPACTRQGLLSSMPADPLPRNCPGLFSRIRVGNAVSVSHALLGAKWHSCHRQSSLLCTITALGWEMDGLMSQARVRITMVTQFLWFSCGISIRRYSFCRFSPLVQRRCNPVNCILFHHLQPWLLLLGLLLRLKSFRVTTIDQSATMFDG